jgi:hypothetical protein
MSEVAVAKARLPVVSMNVLGLFGRECSGTPSRFREISRL